MNEIKLTVVRDVVDYRDKLFFKNVVRDVVDYRDKLFFRAKRIG